MNLDLISVSQDFQRYRGDRKRSKYPQILWDKAIELCAEYPVREISESLKVNRETLSRRLKKSMKSSNEQFIPIKISQQSSAQLHIQSSNPISIDFHGSGKELAELIIALQKGVA